MKNFWILQNSDIDLVTSCFIRILDQYYSWFALVFRAGLLSSFYSFKGVVVKVLNMSKTFQTYTSFHEFYRVRRYVLRLKAGVDRCSFQTKNQMVFVKKTHCKMWLYFDMVGHRRVIKGY